MRAEGGNAVGSRAFVNDQPVSVALLRELAQQQNQEPDPWAALTPQAEEEYYQPQQPAFDPQALQQAVNAQIAQQFAEYQAQQQQAQQQAAYEAEFTREIEKAAKDRDFDDAWMLPLAAEANSLRQSMPYATTAEIAKQAAERIDAAVTKRLQALSTRQQETTSPGLPPGPLPSGQQVPQSVAEANEAAKRFFTN